MDSNVYRITAPGYEGTWVEEERLKLQNGGQLNKTDPKQKEKLLEIERRRLLLLRQNILDTDIRKNQINNEVNDQIDANTSQILNNLRKVINQSSDFPQIV